MRSYKFSRKTDLLRARRKQFLADLNDDVIYYINSIGGKDLFY